MPKRQSAVLELRLLGHQPLETEIDLPRTPNQPLEIDFEHRVEVRLSLLSYSRGVIGIIGSSGSTFKRLYSGIRRNFRASLTCRMVCRVVS